MFEPEFPSDIPPALSHRPLRLPILAILVVAAGLAGLTPVSANPNNPTSIEDCSAQTQQFDSRIATLREQLPMCGARNIYESFVMVPQCNYPTNQSCVALEAQICQLVDQKFAARDMCMERLQLHWQAEADERRRQADEQRAAEARQREAAEQERAQSDPMAAAANVQLGAVAGGLGAAAAGGIPVGLPIGALHLSNEFSAIGGAAANRIRMDSIIQLEDALNAALGMSTAGAGLNASYDRRPTQAQIAYELNAPLDQAERAAALQVHLPFGGESAVVGANAQYLTDLAYARANGTLTTPLAQTQVQSAIGSAGVTGGQGATLAIIEDDEPQRQPSEYEDGLLQQQRLASLGDIQGRLQREQLAEAERQRAMQEQWALQEQQRVVQEQQHSRETSTEEGFSKPDCVEVEHLQSVPGFSMIRNYCGYDILISMTNKPVMNYGSNYTCDRNLNMRAYITSPWPSHDFNQIVWECVLSITRN